MNQTELIELQRKVTEAQIVNKARIDTITAMREYMLFRAAAPKTEGHEEDLPVCVVTSNIHIFGSDAVAYSEMLETERNVSAIPSKATLEAMGVTVFIPHSSSEFINAMEANGTIGALVPLESDRGTAGHAIGIVPTWKFDKVNLLEVEPQRIFDIVDTRITQRLLTVESEELAELYAQAVMFLFSADSTTRGILVFQRTSVDSY